MNLFRFALVGCLLLGLTALARAEDKKDDKKDANKDKIVGVWEATKGNLPKGTTVEFTKDGKLKLAIDAGGQKITIDGTYKVDGDTVMLTMKQGDKEITEKITIKSVTDKMLVTVDKDGKEDEFTKK